MGANGRPRRTAVVNLGHGLAGRAVPGDGAETVLWLHGYTLDSSCWSGLWERLPEQSHVGIDLPGHGNSLPLAADLALPELALRVAAVAEAQEARHLVAHSFGAILALQVVIERPAAVETLALAAPLLGGGPFEADVRERYGAVKELWAAGGWSPALAEVWLADGASLFDGGETVREEIRAQAARHPWWELADDAYDELWHTPQRLKQLAGIEQPTLVLLGGGERPSVVQSVDFLTRLLPRARRRDLPARGHLAVLEAADAAADALRGHWSAASSGAAGEVSAARAGAD